MFGSNLNSAIGLLVFCWFIPSLAGCGNDPQPTVIPDVEPKQVEKIAQDASAKAAFAELTGARLKEDAAGNVLSLDLTVCGPGWSENLNNILGLPALRSISIKGPEANNAMAEIIGQHPMIEAIKLSQSPITIEGITAISKMPRLNDLLLDRVAIGDDAIKVLAENVPNLKRLRLPRGKFTNKTLEYLQNSEQLELLDLSDCPKFSSDGLKFISGLTKMRSIRLWGPQITDSGLVYLKSMTNMVALSFQDCEITDAGFANFTDMKKLQEIGVFRTKIGDGALGYLSGASSMKKLNFRDSLITDAGLEQLPNFPELQNLDLSETGITDKGIEFIRQSKTLTNLNLWRTKVTDAGIAQLTELPLQKLNLDDIWDITDGSIEPISKMTNLTFLHLGKTGVTDTGVEQLTTLVNLQELRLNNTAVSKKAVEALQAKLPNLTKVQL